MPIGCNRRGSWFKRMNQLLLCTTALGGSGDTVGNSTGVEQHTKPIAFYVPANLDLSEINRELRMGCGYLLNLIHLRWTRWQADERGFVRLKRAYLDQVLGVQLAERVRHELGRRRVLEIDKHYVPGQYSMGYRIATQYRRSTRIECTDASLATRIRKRSCGRSGVSLRVHKWLRHSLGSIKFELDNALQVIERMVPDSDSPLSVEDYRELIREQCKRIQFGDLQLSCDRFGRVHTPITSLPKPLRSCLALSGELFGRLRPSQLPALIGGPCRG